MNDPLAHESAVAPRFHTLSNWILAAFCGVAYYFSNPNPSNFYDYTFRVAGNFLYGRIAFADRQSAALNEFVLVDGLYYSVFPLGSVLSMVPFAALKAAGFIAEMPAAYIAGLLSGSTCLVLSLIARQYEVAGSRAILMPLGMLFGTWTWTNLTFGGAWQIALGFALLGELAAIYFTVYARRPWIAGCFFALAFGNRTEVLLTAPVFVYLLFRSAKSDRIADANPASQPLAQAEAPKAGKFRTQHSVFRTILYFCSVPFLLGVATLIYNYLRFQSFIDFGYARIPGVLNEPWYRYGIFSIWYIPDQIWQMLLKPWESRSTFPYYLPNGFSSSILVSSPFILFSLRFGARDRALKYASWAAIGILCLVLWVHGNAGGWQFGYRYAMVCLPWLFVVLLESSPEHLTKLEWAAYIFSIAANAYATWLFHWTEYMRV